MVDLEAPFPPNKPAASSEPSDGLEGFPVYIRWLIKIGTVVLGLITIFLGIFAAISVKPLCIVGGSLAAVTGFLIIGLEAPIMCSCVTFMQPLLALSRDRPPLLKSIIYSVPAIGVIALCQNVEAIFAFLCILFVAAIYFVIFFMKARR